MKREDRVKGGKMKWLEKKSRKYKRRKQDTEKRERENPIRKHSAKKSYCKRERKPKFKKSKRNDEIRTPITELAWTRCSLTLNPTAAEIRPTKVSDL